MSLVICPAYLPSIYYFYFLIKNDKITWYIHGDYQKQTFRNRTKIYSSNGLFKMYIPVVKAKNEKERKDLKTKICYEENWQKQHWKTIENSYSSSPYFEFYKYELIGFYKSKFEYLMDYNIKLIMTLLSILKIKLKTKSSKKILFQNENEKEIISTKQKKKIIFNKYTQVFSKKHGYLENLSVIDLIFNLGPESIDFINNLEKN